MAEIIYRPNPAAVAEIEHSVAMRAMLHERADGMAGRSRSIAPVLTGDYRDSIHVEDGEFEGKAAAIVTASDPASVYIEFGTSDTPEFAPLRKGITGF